MITKNDTSKYSLVNGSDGFSWLDGIIHIVKVGRLVILGVSDLSMKGTGDLVVTAAPKSLIWATSTATGLTRRSSNDTEKVANIVHIYTGPTYITIHKYYPRSSTEEAVWGQMIYLSNDEI